MSADTPSSPRPARSRRFLKVLAALVILLILGVAFAPTLIGATIGPRLVAGALRDAVNGDVSVDGVRLGWTAPQRAEGVRILDKAGGTSIRANVSLDRSLLSLVTDAMGELSLTADADVTTTEDADGTLGISRLAKPTPPSTSASAPLPPGFSVKLALAPSSLTIDRGARGKVALTNLAGSAAFAARDGRATVQLKGDLASSGGPGTLRLDADLAKVVDAAQNPTLHAMEGKASLVAGPLSVATADGTASIGQVSVTIAADPGKPVSVRMEVPSAAAADVQATDVVASLSLSRDPGAAAGVSLADVTALLERGSLRVARGEQPLTASGLSGRVSTTKDGSLSFQLAGTTMVGAQGGKVSATGAFAHALSPEMKPTPGVMTGSANVLIESAILPARDLTVTVDRLSVDVDAKDAAAPFQVTASGNGSVRERSAAAPAAPADAAAPAPAATATASLPSTLAAQFSVARDPASAAGISTDLRTLRGRVEAKGLPTGALQPFLGGLPAEVSIVPSRDVGPTVDVTLAAAGGSAPLQASIRARNLTLDANAVVDAGSGAISGGDVTLNTTVQPGLLAKGPVSLPAPLPLAVSAKGVTLPRGAGGYQLEGAAFDLQVSTRGSVSVVVSEGKPANLGPQEIHLRSAGLGRGAELNLAGTVDAIPLSVDGTISSLVGPQGFTLDAARAKARAKAGPLDWNNPPPLTRATAGQEAAKDIAALLRAQGLSRTNATLDLDAGLSSGRATVHAEDGPQKVDTTVEWTANEFNVRSSSAVLLVRNESLQAMEVDGVTLAAPATVTLTVEPCSLQRDSKEGFSQLPPLQGTLACESLSVTAAPGIHRPATLSSFNATWSIDMRGDLDASVKGTTLLADAGGSLGKLGFSFQGQRLRLPARTWNASVDGSELAGVRLLSVAGVESVPVPGVTAADRGTVKATAAAAANGTLATTLNLAMGDLAANGVATLAPDGAIQIPQASLKVTMDAARATAFFAAEKDEEGAQLVRTSTALPMELTVSDLQVPAAGAAGRPLGHAKGSVRFSAQPFTLEMATGERLAVQATSAAISVPGGGGPATVSLASGIQDKDGSTRAFTLKANVSGYADAAGHLEDEAVAFDGELHGNGMAVPIVDAFLPGDATLTTAIGPSVQTHIVASRAKGASGTVVTGTAQSKYLTVDLGRMEFSQGVLEIGEQAPLQVQLIPNKKLRASLLKNINPVLADIRTAGKPISFVVHQLSFPIDGDLRRLDSRFVLTVGDVELERGDQVLNILKLVREDDDGVIPGNVGPLNGTVTEGRLEYENFVLSLGRMGPTSWQQQVFFSGDVDLGSTPPYANAINVDYPLESIGNLATGQTPFSGFFGRVNTLLSKTPIISRGSIRVRVTFSGPIEKDKDLAIAFEPVLVFPPGQGSLEAIVDGVFGQNGILRIPGLGGSDQGAGGTGGSAGSTGQGAPGAQGGQGGQSGQQGQGGQNGQGGGILGGVKGTLDDLFGGKKKN